MNKVKLLEVKKLLKELEFIESDFEYRNEIISEADARFISSINQFLQNHPDLKEIYDNKVTEKINQSIKKTQENEEEKIEQITDNISEDGTNEQKDESEEIRDTEEKDKNTKHLTKIKKLYREIVKLTHPDKIKNERLNEIYLKATKYYDSGNKIGIYAVCNELSIHYELESEDVQLIYNEIQKYQQKINFIESTYTWKWYNCENDEQKDQILLNYIKLKIR
jgi:hypothetical protein